MSTLRWLAVGVVAGVLGAGARADDKTDYAKMLVGKWEVTKADPDTVPVGAVVEFAKDGKVKFHAKKDGEDVAIDGTYKVEKNTFTLIMKAGDEEHSETITITKMSDGEMSTVNKNGKKVDLKKK